MVRQVFLPDWLCYSQGSPAGYLTIQSLGLSNISDIFFDFSVNGDYTNWGQWTECDVTCGGGHRQRSRACTNPVPEYGGLNCTHLGDTVQSDVCNTRPCAREYFRKGRCRYSFFVYSIPS